MRRNIANQLDYMVARAQMETDIAREVLERARHSEDYHKEKAAAKLVAFHENEEKMIMLYAEAKAYYPDLADVLERRRPHLKDLYEEAGLLWEAV
ncbi:MAG: hypothetical protein WDZ88_00615 [Candidatus Paceibacterota bacterium]